MQNRAIDLPSISESGSCFINIIRRHFQEDTNLGTSSAFLKSFLRLAGDELSGLADTRLLKLDGLRKLLTDSFVSPELITRFESLIDVFETSAVSVRCFFCNRDTASKDDFVKSATEYLNAYFELMRCILLEWKALKRGVNYSAFLCSVLNIGCLYELNELDKHAVGIMTPMAPNYVAAVCAVLNQMDSLLKEHHDSNKYAPLRNDDITREVLLTSVCRYMRWYTVSFDGKLCHVAARPYTENNFERTHLSLRICPLSSYSSFEGVRELRLFEKIKYELEFKQLYRRERVDDSTFNILVAGDLSIKKFEELVSALKGWLENRQREVNWTQTKELNIDICAFSRNPDEASGYHEEYSSSDRQRYGEIFVSSGNYDELFSSPSSFESLIRASDLVFFLDCKELYEKFAPMPHSDLSGLLELSAEETYSSLQRQLSRNNFSLSTSNRYYEFWNLIVGGAYFDSQPMFLKKAVNTAVLEKLESSLKAVDIGCSGYQGFSTTAYVYFSDIEAAQKTHWIKDYFVRDEQNSGKQFSIMRYGEKRDEELKLAGGPGDRIVVFNLWQFVKHIAVSQTEWVIRNLLKGTERLTDKEIFEKLYLLSEILIGIDYRDWPNKVETWYGADSELERIVNHDVLEAYVNKIVLCCFRGDDMDGWVWRSVKRSIDSFLYSDAKNIDDMLFIYLYQSRFELLKTYPDEHAQYMDNLKIAKGKGLKYSGKRYYMQIMHDYDTPARFFPNQYVKLEQMKYGDLEPCDVFYNILQVCANNQYGESNLYKNCLTMLTGRS